MDTNDLLYELIYSLSHFSINRIKCVQPPLPVKKYIVVREIFVSYFIRKPTPNLLIKFLQTKLLGSSSLKFFFDYNFTC